MLSRRPLLAFWFIGLAVLHLASAVRIITDEELATKTSTKGDVIWLSIMGEVYDVTAGKQFYEDGNGYSVFAGRDGSVPFITGKFDEDEASKSIIDNLTEEQIGSLETWREFYEKEDKYPFVGLLVGEMYDKDGNPTETNKKIQEIVVVEKARAEEREKERQAKIAARRAKKKLEAEKKAAEL